MIFKSNGCPETSHDPIAQLSGNPLIPVNDIDHSLDGWLQNPASVLRVAVSNQRRRASDIGEENGYKFPFTFLRASSPLDKILWRLDLGQTLGCRL